MRLKQISLLLILAWNSCFLSAQLVPDIEWQKNYGGNSPDIAYAVQQTTDGGYIVAGGAASQNGDITGNHGTWDVWVLKLNSTGGVEWKKCLGGSSVDQVYSIELTVDGGYILAGSTASSDGDVTGNHGTDKYDYWIVKLSSAGSIQWQKNYGGDGDEEAKSIQQTTDGGYIVTGYTNSMNGDVIGNHDNGGFLNVPYDYWVLKLSSTGNIEWQKCLGGNTMDMGYSIRQTSDGGYIVAGGVRSNDGDITGSYGGFDYWIVKLNSMGAVQWQKRFGGNGFDIATSIRQTSDGGYVVAGSSYSTDGDVTGTHGSDWDYWIVKLNNAGNIEWQKSLGGTASEEAYSIEQTADQGYIVSGYATSSNGDVTEHFGEDDYWIVKLTSNGNIEWQKSLGALYRDRAWCIRQTNDGGFITAGQKTFLSSNPTPGAESHSDFWIVKLGFNTTPVKLLDFSAQKDTKGVVVKWQTAEEVNTKNFEIQRSKNGIEFTTIGIVNQTGGNSAETKYYSFKDNNPFYNTNYYRLKQNDNTGYFQYSKIAKTVFTKNTSFVYPNPANEIINIISSDKLKAMLIIDVNGKTIRYLKSSINNQYNISTLKKGSYTLKLVYENWHETIQLNKL